MKPALKSAASALTLAAFALLAVASGGKKTDAAAEGGASASGARTVKASCNQSSALGSCTEYPKGSTFVLAQGVCGMIDAGAAEGWGTKPCPDERVVGKCVNSTKDAFYADETEYYYAPQHTAESAQKDCVTDAVTKGKTFTAGTWKPADGEARGSCIRKVIGSTRTTPDLCSEHLYGTNEDWEFIKMSCSNEGQDTFVVGKACPKEMKDNAASKCEQKGGGVVYYQDAKMGAKESCEGKYTKLGGGAAAAPAAPAGKPAAPKATAAPKPPAKH